MAPNIHFPEAILRVHETLREEQVFEPVCVDRRNTQIVAKNVNAGVQANEFHLAINLGERCAHQVHPVTDNANHDETEDQPDHKENAYPGAHAITVVG